jgi:hypothetical protein
MDDAAKTVPVNATLFLLLSKAKKEKGIKQVFFFFDISNHEQLC